MEDGFLKKLKAVIGIEEIEYEEEEPAEEEIKPQSFRREIGEPREKEKPAPRVFGGNPKVSGSNQLKMIVIEPREFEESPKLVDSLKAKKPVIINLEKLDTDVARKIFDFLSGATYALDGNVQKIANNIFVFAPENVDIDAYIDQQGSSVFSHEPDSPWR